MKTLHQQLTAANIAYGEAVAELDVFNPWDAACAKVDKALARVERIQRSIEVRESAAKIIREKV